MLESIDKIKSMTTEQLKQVKVALEKILREGTYRSHPDNYKAAWGLVVMEIKYREQLTKEAIRSNK